MTTKEERILSHPEGNGQGTRKAYKPTALGRFQQAFDTRKPIPQPESFFSAPPPHIREAFEACRIPTDRYWQALANELIDRESRGDK